MGPMELSEARQRIREQADLNAFISISEENGSGTVVAVKDLIDVAGMVTTAGGIILPKVPAAADAPVIKHIRAAGCVVVGKANLHEFAYGVTSVNPHYGPVLNPHDPSRVAGGSSGGSAVAVAAGMCDWAVGSDTGGSVRIPALGSSVGAFAVLGGPIGGAGIAGEALGAPALACASSLQMAASVTVGCCACVLVTTRRIATAMTNPCRCRAYSSSPSVAEILRG